MSISDEIEKLQDNLEDSYTAVENKGGTLPSNQCFDNLAEAIETIETGGAIETLNVTPTTSAQTINPPTGTDGYAPVNVSAVDASIDSNITPANIVAGKSILGVNGSATVLNGETRSVSLTNANGQTFTPSSGKNGITSITVTPNNQNRTVTPTTNQQTLTVNSGYSGNGTVTVGAVDASIDSNISPNKIRNGCIILGVTGTYGEPIPVLVSLSSTTSCYIEDSNFYLCGRNNYGQQGTGDTTDVLTFRKVAENVAQLFLSDDSSGYLTTSGDFYLCGWNYYGNQGNGSSSSSNVTTFIKRAENVAQIFLTFHTSGYVTTLGDFYLCGIGSYGQQGNGTTNTSSIRTFTKRAENVAQIFLSSDSSGYLTTSGDFYLCGYNNYGQQGNGRSGYGEYVTTFTKRAENVVQIFLSGSIGGGTSGYLTLSGDFYLCGYNNYGQQGAGNTTNVTIFTKRAENVAQIFLSNYTSGYLTTSGDFYLCGRNDSGQQGTGDTTNVTTFRKVAENVVQIALSGNTTGYLTTSGDFYLCGNNSSGQQGTGDTANVTSFRKVAENVAQIVLSSSTSGYLTTLGDFYLCGGNSNGQQGSGNTTNVLTFTKRN